MRGTRKATRRSGCRRWRGLTGLTSLLDGVTKMRVWQATPTRWRVDVLSDAGERDTYQLSGCRSYIWDSGDELLTEVRGRQTFRLPRPADLVPPALALRLLSEAGRQATFSVIAPLRVAGRSAAGLRMTPADPASTVGHVDIWADPASGLPLMVEIFSRGSARPALKSQFFQVSPWHPDPRVLTPVRASGTGFTVTSARNLAGALSNLGLRGAARRSWRAGTASRCRQGFEAIGVYGGGLATFVVLGVRGSAGQNLVADALSAGGTALDVTGGTGALISAPLINAVIVRPSGFFVTFLIAGTVEYPGARAGGDHARDG